MLARKWRDFVTHLSRHERELDLERIVFLHKRSVQDVIVSKIWEKSIGDKTASTFR